MWLLFFSASVLFAWERSAKIISLRTGAEITSQFCHSTQLQVWTAVAEVDGIPAWC